MAQNLWERPTNELEVQADHAGFCLNGQEPELGWLRDLAQSPSKRLTLAAIGSRYRDPEPYIRQRSGNPKEK